MKEAGIYFNKSSIFILIDNYTCRTLLYLCDFAPVFPAWNNISPKQYLINKPLLCNKALEI